MTAEPVPPQVVPRGRNAYQVWVLVACILSGMTTLYRLMGLDGVSGPGSLEREGVGPVVLTMWAVALLIGGTVSLVGVSIKPPLGLLIERLGIVFLVGPGAAYTIASAAVAGATPGVLMLAAFTLAGVWRIGQITLDLRKLGVRGLVRK